MKPFVLRVAHTQSSAPAQVDLPELDAFLYARRCHGALAGVGLAVAGAQRLAVQRARLRQIEELGSTGERLHPAHGVQAVLDVPLTRVCGDTDTHEYAPRQRTVCPVVYLCEWLIICEYFSALIRLWGIERESLNQKRLCPRFGPQWRKQTAITWPKKKHLKTQQNILCAGLISSELAFLPN